MQKGAIARKKNWNRRVKPVFMENGRMNNVTLTVIIAAKNEGHQIRACVESVAFANEILVLDSGSTDNTAEQARSAGAVVHITDWPGYGPQQQRGINLAKSDWVLSLDADEIVSEALRQEIVKVINGGPFDSYRLPRYSSFCGAFIEHSGWRPDYTLRLVRTSLAGFTSHFLHAHMTVNGTTGHLNSPLIHYSYRSLDDVLEKLNRYSRGAASDLQDRQASSTLTKAILKGFWSFIRTYFLKQGFRDGKMGLVLAIYNSQTTYYKYLRLWIQGRAKDQSQ
jgi:glycosyltransferase involved in cell wall biosynthesis